MGKNAQRYGDEAADLAAFIRSLRAAERMTQEELAEKVGVSRVTILRIETGDYPINAWHLEHIGRVFGLKGSELMARAGH